MKLSNATLFFALLNAPARLFLAVLLLRSVKISVISIASLTLIATILILKSMTVESIVGLTLFSKFLFLVLGASLADGLVGKKFLEHQDTFFRYSGYFLILVIFIQIFGGVDIWSGSGSYGIRTPSSFSGFGELAVFIGASLFFRGFQPLTLLVGILSTSKIVLLAIFLHILAFRRQILFFSLICAACLVFLLNYFFYDTTWFSRFESSVLNFDLSTATYANRIDSTQAVFDNVKDSVFHIILGLNTTDLFLVSPEYTLGYLIKIGGLALAVCFAVYYFSVCGFSLLSFYFFFICMASTYAASAVALLMIGFFTASHKRQRYAHHHRTA